MSKFRHSNGIGYWEISLQRQHEAMLTHWKLPPVQRRWPQLKGASAVTPDWFGPDAEYFQQEART